MRESAKHALPCCVSLDEPHIRELIGVADTAKRLRRHELSNLLFAYLAYTSAERLQGNLFLEERTARMPYIPHRFYDLYALQLPEPRAYLCIPYPLLNFHFANHLETLAHRSKPVAHQRKYYTDRATLAERRSALIERFFSSFPSEAELEQLIRAAGTVLESGECSRGLRMLRQLSDEFFGSALPHALRRLDLRQSGGRRMTTPRT